MTVSAIIEDLYLSPEVDRCIMKMVRVQDRDDFKQELFVIIGTMKPEIIIALHGRNEIKRYVARIIINLCRHKRDVYHKKYLDPKVKYDTDKVNAINPPSDYDQMEQRQEAEEREVRLINEVENFDQVFNSPCYRMLVNLINDNGSMREVSRKTGVPLTTIHVSMKRVREHLRQL